MADVRVRIIGEDAASAEINKVDKSLDGLGNNVKIVGGNWTEFASMLSIAGKAASVVSEVFRQSIGETMSYAKSVRDLSNNLGITTEETSKLIQVADDYGIEIGQVEAAMKMALKNGFSPSIKTLADMADKYVSLHSPTERAAMLTEVFGKNWTVLTPLLKQGGDAIRAQADEISKSLILTEQQTQAARELEIQQDNLNDQVTALKTSIGNALIPALSDLLSWVNQNLTATEQLTATMAESSDQALTNSSSYEEYKASQEAAAAAANLMIDAEGNLTKEHSYNKNMADQVIQSNYLLTESEYENERQTEATAAKEAILAQTYGTAAVASAELTAEEQKQLQAVQELEDGIVGTNDILAKFSATLIFNKAAAGLDAEAALELGRQLGLVDERAVTAISSMEDLRNKYDLNRDGAIDATEATNGYVQAVKALFDRLNSLEDKTVYVDVYTREHGNAGAYGGKTGGGGGATRGTGSGVMQERAAGGPVTAGIPYLVGESGPELFVPSSSGQIISNYNLTINTSAPYEPVVQDFNIMRALAG